MKAALLIAGTHSGVGKTTVALALMAALRRRGLIVQPFKVGPDFIDPGHHTAVCGRVSRNLDTWMLSEETVRATFARAMAGAEIAVIEGVMGLFDGRGSDDLRGSTAHIAQLLGIPVILVVDAAAMAGSVAAVVKGFAEFDPAVRIAGVICNRVAGPSHYQYLEPAIRRHTDVTPLGWLTRREEWKIPERHLGLVTVEDSPQATERWNNFAEALEETVDVDQLLQLIGASRERERPEKLMGSCMFLPVAHAPGSPSVRVAVARDAAFCFYYPENLELLEAAGGEIVPFSPLKDTQLPSGTCLIYLGGGYPELHAATLAVNEPLRNAIQDYHRSGGIIYAECGGLMYTCRELVDAQGHRFPMLDLLPARTVMQPRRAALGYVTLRTVRESPLGPAGTTARGHEFHYSRLEPLGTLDHAAELEPGRLDGLISCGLYAGYAHLHFGSNPSVATALLKAGTFP